MKNTYKVNEEAVKKIAEMVYDNGSTVINRNDLEEMFPALKESEDDEIRKWIRKELESKYVVDNIVNNVMADKALAWLEAQGEHKSIEYPLCKTVKDKIDYYIVNHFTTDTVVKTDVNSIVKAMKEGVMIGMSEQKPADKVEPSIFKDRLLELFQIFRWRCKDHILTNGEILEYVDAHIQELIGTMQKPADTEKGANGNDREIPISAWSEEDEHNLNSVINLVHNTRDGAWGSCVGERIESWLKSLKERYTWKPSGEQMHYLSWIANVRLGDSVVEQEVSKHLNELLEDLKKLREE